MFERHVSLVPMVIWRTVGFLEARELLAHLHLALEHSTEVPSGEDTVVRNQVVGCSWLIVMQVLEAASIRVSQDEWHECVSIIDTIKLLALHKLLQVLFDDRSLMDCCCLSSGSVNSNTISETKDVFESLVLECVGININNTFTIGDS